MSSEQPKAGLVTDESRSPGRLKKALSGETTRDSLKRTVVSMYFSLAGAITVLDSLLLESRFSQEVGMGIFAVGIFSTIAQFGILRKRKDNDKALKEVERQQLESQLVDKLAPIFQQLSSDKSYIELFRDEENGLRDTNVTEICVARTAVNPGKVANLLAITEFQGSHSTTFGPFTAISVEPDSDQISQILNAENRMDDLATLRFANETLDNLKSHNEEQYLKLTI